MAGGMERQFSRIVKAIGCAPPAEIRWLDKIFRPCQTVGSDPERVQQKWIPVLRRDAL
jgi:hypothetical protein